MAALGEMILGDLPPAGHPVLVERGGELPKFAGYDLLWVNSGTAALALALKVARQRRPEVGRPEVILPAYGCPDLVAAVLFSGAHPVLCEIGESDPGYSLLALEAKITSSTVAIVAVNFLGIAERLADLQAITSRHGGIALVEDDAQWFPEPLAGATLTGDMVCLSFGRGKPVNLLQGGALLISRSMPAAGISVPPTHGQQWMTSFKVKLYNALLRPSIYWMVNRNPLLSLGQTAYRPLAGVFAMPSGVLELLPANIAGHCARRRDAEAWLRQALAGIDGVIDLPTKAGIRACRLLRYPVLMQDRRRRDRALIELRRLGLGATSLYSVPLPRVRGVPAVVAVAGEFPAATQFGDRLLTLPVNSFVGLEHVERIRRVISCVE